MITTQFSMMGASTFLPDNLWEQTTSSITRAHQQLTLKSGSGNDFLGWLDIPNEITESKISQIKQAANLLAQQTKVIVVVGIGGSYLGARAVIEALQRHFNDLQDRKSTRLNSSHQIISY